MPTLGVSFVRNLCHLTAIFVGCMLLHVICKCLCTYIPHAQIHMQYNQSFIYIVCVCILLYIYMQS